MKRIARKKYNLGGKCYKGVKAGSFQPNNAVAGVFFITAKSDKLQLYFY